MPGVSARKIEPFRDDAHDQGAWMSSPPTPQVRSLGAGYWLTRNVRRLVRSPDGSAHRARRSRPTPPYARLLDVWAGGRADALARERPPAHRVDATRNAPDASPSTLKPSTQEMYETVLTKHWTPGLGPKPLTGVPRPLGAATDARSLLAKRVGAPPQARGGPLPEAPCRSPHICLPPDPAGRVTGLRPGPDGPPVDQDHGRHLRSLGSRGEQGGGRPARRRDRPQPLRNRQRLSYTRP
jgi:hypothetical protein